MVRNESGSQSFAGLFVYEDKGENESLSAKYLEALAFEAQNDHSRVINWIAVGQDVFIRFLDIREPRHMARKIWVE